MLADIRHSIDEFLGEVSSLCPICKASMLPRGYCPEITNETVRRERAIRRLRHSDPGGVGSYAGSGNRRVWGLESAIKNRISHRKKLTLAPSAPIGSPRLGRKARNHQRRPGSGQRSRETPTSSARDRMRALAGSPLEYRTGTPTTRCK